MLCVVQRHIHKPAFLSTSAHPGEGARVTLEQLPVPGGADRKDGEGLFTRVGRDRTRGNGSKLKEGRFR